jgi:hypothetical protein
MGKARLSSRRTSKDARSKKELNVRQIESKVTRYVAKSKWMMMMIDCLRLSDLTDPGLY